MIAYKVVSICQHATYRKFVSAFTGHITGHQLQYAEGKRTVALDDTLIFCFRTAEQARGLVSEELNHEVWEVKVPGLVEIERVALYPRDYRFFWRNEGWKKSNRIDNTCKAPDGTVGASWVELLRRVT